MRENERVAAFSYRYWRRRGMTAWPTVREVCRALRYRQGLIEDMAGDGLYQLTGFNFVGDRLGDLHVEATTPQVDVDWCAHWLPFSRGCYCGAHREATKEVA